MSLVDDAAALAELAHAGQHRKGGAPGAPKTPYVTHLRSVVERLHGAGVSDEITLAAGWLHDLLEDQPAWAERLRALPPELVATVEALTEPKRDQEGAKLPKRVRFEAYLRLLAAPGEAAARARVVSCADKVDNLESLLDGERRGHRLLAELSTRPGQHRQHVAALRPLYAPSVPPSLLAALDDVAGRFEAYLASWLPGHAVAIAATAHRGQFDRAGAPYIFHPLRLMARAESPVEKMAAVLHDVVEDTPWTLAALADEGFPDEVLEALDCLTKRAGESYEAFIERIAAHPLATRVKLLDLEDNMSVQRLATLEPNDLARLEKYHRARRRLAPAR